MNSSVRISKPAVREILDKYLDEKLAEKIFWEMVDKDEEDQKNVIGMTYGEWKERFDDDRRLVWADDTKAGFGKRGDPVYGDSDDCVICMRSYSGIDKPVTLHVWCEALTTDKAFIHEAMEEHKKRKAEKGGTT